MEKKTELVYFAHPVSHYNTDLETDCEEFIYQTFGSYSEMNSGENIEIFNPNQPMIQNLYKIKKEKDPDNYFDMFEDFARASDYVILTTFMDGTIGTGVHGEGVAALEAGKPVFLITFMELNGNFIKMFKRINNFFGLSVLSIEDTRNRTENEIL